LVSSVSWRAVFLINLPFAAVVVWAAARHVPESNDPLASHHIDWKGAFFGAVGLGGVTYALIEAPDRGTDVRVLAAAAVGVVALAAFGWAEARGRNAMVPLSIFANRQFSAANVVTFAVWGALGSTFFLLVVFLQTVMHYSALRAGMATLPITLILLVFSSRGGAVAERFGPRLPMTAGPLIAAAGVALFSRFHLGTSYVTGILPAVIVFGAGLALTVAPVTATVLGSIETRFAGTGSGVNNAVARAGSLLAVAVIPLVAGLKGDDYRHPAAFTHGYHTAMLISAVATAAGGLIALAFIRSPSAAETSPDAESRPAATPIRCPCPTASPCAHSHLREPAGQR
jgi:MFS family permease